jgi:hypothetical protein
MLIEIEGIHFQALLTRQHFPRNIVSHTYYEHRLWTQRQDLTDLVPVGTPPRKVTRIRLEPIMRGFDLRSSNRTMVAGI